MNQKATSSKARKTKELRGKDKTLVIDCVSSSSCLPVCQFTAHQPIQII